MTDENDTNDEIETQEEREAREARMEERRRNSPEYKIEHMSDKEKDEILAPDKYKFMLLEFGYFRLIVPYEKGMKMMELLRDSEKIEDYSQYGGDRNKIKPIVGEDFRTTIINQEEYLLWKTRALLT
jgi:hypothetical protein